MLRTTFISCTACAAVVLAASTVTPAVAADKEKLFSVPFFLGSNQSIGNPAANFSLAQPAILESFTLTCGIGPSEAYLEIDGGPLGANGTTAVPVDASSNVQIADGITLPITFQYAADGNYHSAPLHLGVPVSLTYRFIVTSPASGQAPSCFGYVTFRTI